MSQPREPGRYYQQPPQRYQQPVTYAPPPEPVRRRRPGRRVPGVGLILTLVALIIQVLSLFVVPWLSVGARNPLSLSLPDLWNAHVDFGTSGFGAWYLVLFSYPLAALGIVLALAAVLDSVVLKVVWGCLALAGVAALLLSYGLWPLFESVATDHGAPFTRQKVTGVIIALVVAAVVIFVLKSALSMFRRVAGLILLLLAGVHVAALVDLVKGQGLDDLSVGAYGPAVAYVLTAVAAFIAPRRVPGV